MDGGFRRSFRSHCYNDPYLRYLWSVWRSTLPLFSRTLRALLLESYIRRIFAISNLYRLRCKAKGQLDLLAAPPFFKTPSKSHTEFFRFSTSRRSQGPVSATLESLANLRTLRLEAGEDAAGVTSNRSEDIFKEGVAWLGVH